MRLTKKNRKTINIIWSIVGGLIIVSMILLYSPIFTSPQRARPVTPSDIERQNAINQESAVQVSEEVVPPAEPERFILDPTP